MADTIGHYGWSRTAAAACFEHKNGVVVTSSSGAAAAIAGGALQIGRDGRQLASVHIGGGLTESEMMALRSADLAYAQAVGAA